MQLTIDDVGRARDDIAALTTQDPARALTRADALLASVLDSPLATDPRATALAHRARAEALLFSGRRDQSVQEFERATRDATRSGDDGLTGQILVGRIGALSLRGDTRGVPQLARRAQRLLESAGDDVYLAKLHMNLGNLAFNREDHARAATEYADAFEVFRRAELRDMTTVGLAINLGVAHTSLGRFDDARAWLTEAIVDAEALGVPLLAGQARLDLASLARIGGDYRHAFDLLDQADVTFDELQVADLSGAAARERAHLNLELGMPREAEREALRAASAFRDAGMLLDAALAELAACRARLDLGDGPGVERLGEALSAWFRSERLHRRRLQVDLLRARAHLRARRLESAVAVAAEVGRAARWLALDDVAAEARLLMARCRLVAHDLPGAGRLTTDVSDWVDRLPLDRRPDALVVAATVAHGLGDHPGARRHVTRAVALVDRIRATVPGPVLRASAFARHAGVLERSIALALDARRIDATRILMLSETARARGFREELRGSKTAQFELARARERLRALDVDTTPPPRRARAERDVLTALRHLTSRDVSVDSTLVDQVRDRLPAGTTVVSYVVADDRAGVVVVTRDACRFVPITTSLASLRKNVRAFTSRIEQAADRVEAGYDVTDDPEIASSTRRVLDTLSKAVLAPVYADIRDELIVLPAGPLHAVPFECLTDGDRVIGDRVPIRRAPTVASLLESDAEASGVGDIVIVSSSRNAPPLVAREADLVATMIGRGERLVDPTTAQFLSAARSARVLHVSAHGEFRSDNPLFSSIMMADGPLTIADLLDHRLRADLVVLGACDTGRAAGGTSDYLPGVAHAFLAAGARTLVAGQWRLHDATTLEFMRAFHAQADALDAPHRALARAREEVRDRWPHPYHWGGLSCHSTRVR